MEVDQGDFFASGVGRRVNGALLKGCSAGATVSLVGQVSGDILATTDGVEVKLANEAGLEVPESGYVEVVGSLSGDLEVKPFRITAFGEAFDAANYDALCGLMQNEKYKQLFA
ncbi:hypothetical protein M885DRAFT_543896 [Pelagophyceae sp. CCMP2097]|nr:hypothetical protein M885DRAFT_543896 [Pelagophyceae sp. CCMP2097]|mmetsp:Transcript_10604/g.36708  ORF Transcript_10604/g.36708 Transcript_10604/m.36708 type:complete len:113 (+) Transcript_10604:71-409(+)